MQNLSENKLMLRSVQICYVTLFACALEVFPPLNALMQLTPLPEDGAEVFSASGGIEEALSFLVDSIGFKSTLGLFMLVDVALSYQVEKIIQQIFNT